MKRALVGLFLASTFASPPASSGESKFLTPGEMLKAMEESKTVYKFDTLDSLKEMGPEQFAEAYWPSSKNELEFPWIVEDGKGGIGLSAYTFEGGSAEILKEAESAYLEREYDRAARLYRKALKASPKCYFAHIGLGDCRFMEKKYEEAIDHYDKGIALNPHDFRGVFFRAHALARLGRLAEAKTGFVESLAIKPRRQSVVTVVRRYAEQIGVSVADTPFLPRSLARIDGETIALHARPDDLPWFAHAVCKAFWLGEPEHRRQLTGSEEKKWSTSEESECLAALVIAYRQAREDGTIMFDPLIERVDRILQDGMLNQFIYYEIYARLSPDMILLLPAAEREKLKTYVGRYVLAPIDPAGDGG